MAGRPPLRIGQHGKISRTYLGGGVWMARCRHRDSDGVTRIVERRGPADEHDKRGKLAEDALIEALASRRAPGSADAVTLDTKITVLIDRHLVRLVEDGRAVKTVETYQYDAANFIKFIGGVRVGEATPARIDAALRSMRTKHGVTAARRSRTVLRGALQLAVLANVIGSNPVRDVSAIKSQRAPKGATALNSEMLRELITKLRCSGYCRDRDLVDPITILIATGLRRSELLGLRWVDYDDAAGTITVTGKVVRVKAQGLMRLDETKSAASRRTVPLPQFAIETLRARHAKPYIGEQAVIFASAAGTLRDPGNFGAQWRKVRDELGVPGVTTHGFRKTVATLIDEEGLSARIGADHLGHTHVSMTMDRYMARGRIHTQVADLLDKTVGISGE